MDNEAGRALFYILVEAEGGSAGKPLILWTNVRCTALQRPVCSALEPRVSTVLAYWAL